VVKKIAVAILGLLACGCGDLGQIKQITGGGYHDGNGAPCVGCILQLIPSNDAVVQGTGQIVSKLLTFALDSSGNVPAGSNIWFNDQLQPTGTVYEASLTYPGGGTLWGPEYFYLNGASPLSLQSVIPANSAQVYSAYAVKMGANNILAGNNTFSGNKRFTGKDILSADNSTRGANTASTLNSVLYVGGAISTWSGSDIGAQINSAYAALPATGGLIHVLPQASGACYNFSTPIALTTLGKFTILQGAAANAYTSSNYTGVCLNFTTTTNTCVASGQAQGGSSPCNAINIDWGSPTGTGNTPGAGLRDMLLWNNTCGTNGGCGSSASGVVLGGTNGGAESSEFDNVSVVGFGSGYKILDSGIGWGVVWNNATIQQNTTGINYTQPHENDVCEACKIQKNGTGVNMAASPFGGELTLLGGSVDAQTTCGVSMTDGQILHAVGTHWENTSLGQPAYVCGGAAAQNRLDINGGVAYDVVTSGSTSQNWFVAGMVSVSNLHLISFGRTTTATIFIANTRGKFDVVTNFGNLFTGGINGNSSNFSVFTQHGAAQSLPVTNIPIVDFPELSAPTGFTQRGLDNCYGDATAHTLKCSYNNGNFHKVAITEFGSCDMSGGTSCTFSVGAAFINTPLSFASIDAASDVPAAANSAKCSISGTTVTIIAAISNSLTWDCLLVGNPN